MNPYKKQPFVVFYERVPAEGEPYLQYETFKLRADAEDRMNDLKYHEKSACKINLFEWVSEK